MVGLLFQKRGTQGQSRSRQLKDDKSMKHEDKWREKDIAHLFMFLCVMQKDHQSLISSVFISFIKKFMQQAIINHSLDLIGCQF